LEEHEEIITKDCEECEKICSSTLSDDCINCIGNRKFKILRLKNDLFTKEYDKKRRLLAVIPFFMDVRFDHRPEDLKPRETYFLTTGAKVDICESGSNVGYAYFIKIPEINVTFQELMDIKKEFDKFKNSLDVTVDGLLTYEREIGKFESRTRSDLQRIEAQVNAAFDNGYLLEEARNNLLEYARA